MLTVHMLLTFSLHTSSTATPSNAKPMFPFEIVSAFDAQLIFIQESPCSLCHTMLFAKWSPALFARDSHDHLHHESLECSIYALSIPTNDSRSHVAMEAADSLESPDMLLAHGAKH